MAMSNMVQVAILAMLVTSMATAPVIGAPSVTCEQATMLLMPCIGYGVMGGLVPQQCCEGLRKLDEAEKTREDRQASCYCVNNGAKNIPGLDYDRVNELPSKCGAVCPYKVGPDTDCSKVQ